MGLSGGWQTRLQCATLLLRDFKTKFAVFLLVFVTQGTILVIKIEPSVIQQHHRAAASPAAMTISFVLLVNKQGQTRLAKYTDQEMSVEEKRALEGEIVRKCLTRSEKQVSHCEMHPPRYPPRSTSAPLWSIAITRSSTGGTPRCSFWLAWTVTRCAFCNRKSLRVCIDTHTE